MAEHTHKTLGEWMIACQLVDQTVADGVGITRAYLTRVRNGMVHPSLGTALAIWEYGRREFPLESLLPRHMRSQAEPAPPLAKPVAKAKPKPEPEPAAKPGTSRKPAAPKVYRARASA